MIKRVYLSGPDVYLPNARSHGEHMKEICRSYHLEGILPLNALSASFSCRQDFALSIRNSNLHNIASCDGIIVNMSPFRGPSMDVGAAYEMGAAQALGLPLVGYSTNRAEYRTKLRRYADIHSIGDELYAGDGMTVEDFGLGDTLM